MDNIEQKEADLQYINNRHLNTQCFIRTFHKYGFDKDLKSHFRGQGVSETKLETFTRLLMPTEDQGGGAEGCF